MVFRRSAIATASLCIVAVCGCGSSDSSSGDSDNGGLPSDDQQNAGSVGIGPLKLRKSFDLHANKGSADFRNLHDAKLSPDGRYAVTVAGSYWNDPSMIDIIDLSSNAVLSSWTANFPIGINKLIPTDNGWFIAGDGETIRFIRLDGTKIAVSNVQIKPESNGLQALTGYGGGDGTPVAIAGGYQTGVTVWTAGHTSPDQRMKISNADEDNIEELQMLPSSRDLVAAYWGGAMRIWNLDTRKSVQFDDGVFEGPPTRLALSSDGKRLAEGDGDGVVVIYDISNHSKPTQLMKFDAHGASIAGIVFAPGDRMITSAQDNRLKVWQLDLGQKTASNLQDVDLHANPDEDAWAVDMSLSPSNILVTGLRNGLVKTWDLK